MIPALILACLAPASPQLDPVEQEAASDGYRGLFGRGLAALANGENGDARLHFRAAGEIAPDAPVWRVYAAHAAGRAPRPKAKRLRHHPPWTATRPHVGWYSTLGPHAERLLVGSSVVDLIDLRSGDLVARLKYRLSGRCNRWVFDSTGTLVIGLPAWGKGEYLEPGVGIDVRDARTGLPVRVTGSEALTTPYGSEFEWLPTVGSPVAPDPTVALDLAAKRGILRCHVTAWVKGSYTVMSADRRRVRVVDPTVPSMLRIVNRETDETLLTLEGAGWCSFSRDGTKLLSRWHNSLRVFATESGEELLAPSPPANTAVADRHHTFLGDRLVTLLEDGEITAFHTGTGEVTQLPELRPAPPDFIGHIEFAAAGRVLVVFGGIEINAYHFATGERLWTRKARRWPMNGAFDDARQYVTAIGDNGNAIVLDVLTGESVLPRRAAPLQTTTLGTFPGKQTVIVAASDGSLRCVDLETGATTAFASEHEGRSPIGLRSVTSGRILSDERGGSALLRDEEALTVVAGATLEDGYHVSASSASGWHVIAQRIHPGSASLVALDEAGTGTELARIDGRCPAVAFSPDGDQVALVRQGRMVVLSVATGEIVVDREAFTDRDISDAVFHGDDLIVVGWSGDSWEAGTTPGVVVIRATDGTVVTTLEDAPIPPFSGEVRSLQGHPEEGLVTFSITPSGYTCAYRTDDWSRAWVIDSRGGNEGEIVLEHLFGEPRAYISALYIYSLVIDVTTGREIEHEAVRGLQFLAGSPQSRYVVGIRDQVLVVLDGETHEVLYRRTEARDGAAWIERDGRRVPAAGGPTVLDDPTHLIRQGWSVPVDAWDAWLVDPLGLVGIELDELPAPPRVIAGPPRVVHAAEDTTTLTIEVECATRLLGTRVEAEGRPPRFVPLPPGRRADGVTTIDVKIPGPWPAEARLRAISRRGIMSPAYRVLIER